MEFKFLIRNHRAKSFNNAYTTRDRRKSKETVAWLFDLKSALRQYPKQIQKFREVFNKNKHFLTVSYIYFIPEKKFFTAKKPKHISVRTQDWSNLPKLPDDAVFNDILGTDDAFVCKGEVYKLPSKVKEHNLLLTVQILPLDALYAKAEQLLPEALR